MERTPVATAVYDLLSPKEKCESRPSIQQQQLLDGHQLIWRISSEILLESIQIGNQQQLSASGYYSARPRSISNNACVYMYIDTALCCMI